MIDGWRRALCVAALVLLVAVSLLVAERLDRPGGTRVVAKFTDPLHAVSAERRHDPPVREPTEAEAVGNHGQPRLVAGRMTVFDGPTLDLAPSGYFVAHAKAGGDPTSIAVVDG